MPYYKCVSCHHEFEGSKSKKDVLCDWCSSPTYILEKRTPLEKMCKDIEEHGGFENWMKNKTIG